MVNVKRLPKPIWQSYEWQYDGACVDLDVNQFFPPEDERGLRREMREQAAKKVCGDCPVVQQCLQHALKVREQHGIWGGLNPSERAQIAQRPGITAA